MIVRPTKNAGVNLETREEMKTKHGHFKGHDINREMKIVKGAYDTEKSNNKKSSACFIF